MKLWKVLAPITICLLLILVLLPTQANAAIVDSGTCGANLTWTLDDEGTLTISGTGPMEDYDYEVPWYSNVSSIKKVVIKEGVTTIGENAFSWSDGLTNVAIPDSITTIGSFAFSDCTNLTNVRIPDSVTTIGNAVFAECTRLTGIYVDINNPNYCSDSKGVLYNKEKTVLIQAPGMLSEENYTVPNSVFTISDWAFSGCAGLNSVNIPDSVVTIGDEAFSKCENLSTVTMGDGVTTINWSAFSHCTNLITITLGNGVNVIGYGAFAYCTRLTTVNIPDSVKTIAQSAFEGCSSLSDVFYYGTPERWELISIGWYNECLTGATLHIRELLDSGTCGENISWTLDNFGTLTISGTGPMREYYRENTGPYADNDTPWYSIRSTIRTIVVEDGVTAIGSCAFDHCYNCTTVKLPESVMSIGSRAFYNCASLISITIPSSVISIGESAFSSCSNLFSVTIPVGVTVITRCVFDDCQRLTHVWYTGTWADRNAISIDYGNDDLMLAIWHNDACPIGADHTFDDVCDAGCNSCDFTRTPLHSYETERKYNEVFCWRECVFCKQKAEQIKHISDGEGGCAFCTWKAWVPGNVDGTENVTTDDAVYLLLHVMFGESYYPAPDGISMDFDGSGSVTTDDAVYLLLHVMFGESYYPLKA